jgi:hypothetical protein
MTEEEARESARQFEAILGIPVVLPLEDGVDALVPLFGKMINNHLAKA